MWPMGLLFLKTTWKIWYEAVNFRTLTPKGPEGQGQNCPNIDKFSKIFFATFAQVKEKLCAYADQEVLC